MKRDVESLQDVPPDAPLRLGIAAGLAYPDGSMMPSRADSLERGHA